MQYLVAFCNPNGKGIDVISGSFVGPIVTDKRVKFPDPRLNRSREIPPELVGGGIFDGFFRDNFGLELVRVMSYRVLM